MATGDGFPLPPVSLITYVGPPVWNGFGGQLVQDSAGTLWMWYPGGTDWESISGGGGGGGITDIVGGTAITVTNGTGPTTTVAVTAGSFDAAGSAATAQSNAESFATGAANTAQSNAEAASLPSTETLNAIGTSNPNTAAVPMNAKKITGLANGTVSTDAAAFGQIPTTYGQVVFDFPGTLVVNTITDYFVAAFAYTFTLYALGAITPSSSGSITVSIIHNGSAIETLTLTATSSTADGTLGTSITVAAGDTVQVKITAVGTSSTGLSVTLA